MKNLSVILPVHEVTEENKNYITKAINSLEGIDDATLIIVHPPSVERSSLPIGDTPLGLKLVLNSGETDFCSQVNLGIDNVETEWFTILEMDDRFTKKWFQNVDKYSKAYNDVDVFLPIVADVDEKDNFLSFTNETLWALGFSDHQGYLDNNILLEYQNFQISGAAYKTEPIKKYGKLKTNIPLLFGYEFFLRLTHNNAKIMTIPKIGYYHTTMRTNSLFWKYKNDDSMKMSPEQSKQWLEIAKREYFFTEEREINQY